MTAFKVGDRVRVLDTEETRADGYEYHFGLIGVVIGTRDIGVEEELQYNVRFWFPDTGVDYQSFYADQLERVTDAPEA